MDVINLSLSTRKQEFVPTLHELADRAYFQGTVLVAANNVPVHTYPWLFSSIVSVASHAERDPYTFYYNPSPPVKFTAPGAGLMAGRRARQRPRWSWRASSRTWAAAANADAASPPTC